MKAKTRRKIKRAAVHVIFIIYLIIMAYFLFFSERYGREVAESYRYNLKPFHEIKRYIMYREIFGLEYFLVNIFGNVLAFAPFGFLLPIVSEQNRRFYWAVLCSAELSFCIELIQLLAQVGSFDIDDVIMNTLGAAIGYIVFAVNRKRLEPIL